jgi:cytochrome c oxidase subunit 3
MQTFVAMPTEKQKQAGAVRLVMYLYLAATFMAFAGLTSAYIVTKAEGKMQTFTLTPIFYVNTLVLLMSSVTLHLAYLNAKQNKVSRLQGWLFATALLAVAFVFGQVIAWQKLVAQGVYLVGNASGGFLYILTGLHGLHVVAGIVALSVMLISAIRLRISNDNLQGLQLFATFWHTMDFLWIYLFVFLLVNHL